MADRRDSSADSDKIKQLLAQLRAKFEMEENAGSEEEGEEQPSSSFPEEDEAPTVSFPVIREEQPHEKEQEEIYPIRELSRTFGAIEEKDDVPDDWQYITPEDDGYGDQTGYGNGEYGEADYGAREEADMPGGAASSPMEKESELPRPQPQQAWDDAEDETVPFAHTPAMDGTAAESGEPVEMNHADGEGFGDETLAFFLDRYAIAPKRGEKNKEEHAPSASARKETGHEENAGYQTESERLNVSPYRAAPEKAKVSFPAIDSGGTAESIREKPNPAHSAPSTPEQSATRDASAKEDKEREEQRRLAQEFDFRKPPVQVDFAPSEPAFVDSETKARPTTNDESPLDYRDAPTDYGIMPNPRPVRADHEESGHTVTFPFASVGQGAAPELLQDEPEAEESPAMPPVATKREAPETAEKERAIPTAQAVEVRPEQSKEPSPEPSKMPAQPSGSEPETVGEPAPSPSTETQKKEETPVCPPAQETEEREERAEDSPAASPEKAATPKRDATVPPPRTAGRLFEEEPLAGAGREKKKQPNRRKALSDVEYNSRVQTEKVRRRLLKNIQAARTRLIFAVLVTFALLWLENAQAVGLPLPSFLQSASLLTAVNAACLLACAALCGKELYAGFRSLTTGGPTPASLVLVSLVATFLYTAGAAVCRFVLADGQSIPLFSFVAALSCVLLLSFEVVRRESRYASFRVLAQSGDKLIFSLAPPKDAQVESNVLGKKIGVDIPYIYRVRKTGFVDEFAARTAQNCEDYRLNFWLLCASLAISLIAGVAGAVAGRTVWDCLGGALLALLLALPVCMCASHIFPVSRMISVAGEDSTVLGEKSARECATLDAVEFEDIEAISSHNVRVRHIKMYAGNLDQVLYYVSSLFHLVGGPLRGYFGRSTKELGYSSDAVLTEAVPGGLCAMVDRAHVLLGDGDYMQKNGVKLYFDAEDAHQIESGKICIMYVAVNHRVCAKFYVQYMVSPAFERNVKRLSRHGIATILRTYDPNISNRLLLRISAISDYRVHVVTKTVEQRKDFAAPHLTGGLVTASDSGKLLRLLFLCLQTRSVIIGEGVLKAASVCFGGLVLTGALILGWYRLPSAIFSIHHLIWLGLSLLWAGFGIRKEPEKKKISEKKVKKEKKRTGK